MSRRKTTPKIYIIGEINEEAFVEFSKTLAEFESLGVKSVEIELNSGGGYALDALAFYSRMRISPVAIGITVYGNVASAATLILAAGARRRMAKEAWAMVHEDNLEGISGKTSDIERLAKQMRRAETQWNKILSELTNKDESFWTQFNQRDQYLTPTQCLELGLIDEIV